MPPETLSRRTVAFVNLAHALDHFVLLIFPTAVIAIAAERGLSYAELIGLSTGALVAFGLFSLPAEWLSDRVGRRTLLAVFFVGCGGACLGLATAVTPTAFALWLLVLGVFSSIYHPVGSAMLVTHARRLGRELGINGVWGNLGAASDPRDTIADRARALGAHPADFRAVQPQPERDGASAGHAPALAAADAGQAGAAPSGVARHRGRAGLGSARLV